MFAERQVNDKNKFKNPSMLQTHTKYKYKRRKKGKLTQILAKKDKVKIRQESKDING